MTRRLSLLAALLLLASLAPFAAFAQEAIALGVPTPIEDPSGTFFTRFHRALRRLGRDGDRSVRLAFWGASHTASDQYTGFLRERLVERFGDAGPGFFAPAAPYELHDRRDLRYAASEGFAGVMIKGSHRAPDRYGLAGYALDAVGPAHARVVPRNRAQRIAHVEVYLLEQPGGGHVVLRVGDQTLRIATATSESRLGYATLDVEPGRHPIELEAEGDGPVRVFGVLAEGDRAGIVVDSFGVPGARAHDQALWHEATFVEHLRRRAPDLYAIAYGTNESGGGPAPSIVEREVRDTLARYRRALPDAACLVIGPSDRPRRLPDHSWAPRQRNLQMRDVFRAAALAEGCGFFDLLALQGGPTSIGAWIDAGWALDDHVHMTNEGHERVAELLEEALLAGFRRRR